MLKHVAGNFDQKLALRHGLLRKCRHCHAFLANYGSLVDNRIYLWWVGFKVGGNMSGEANKQTERCNVLTSVKQIYDISSPPTPSPPTPLNLHVHTWSLSHHHKMPHWRLSTKKNPRHISWVSETWFLSISCSQGKFGRKTWIIVSNLGFHYSWCVRKHYSSLQFALRQQSESNVWL